MTLQEAQNNSQFFVYLTGAKKVIKVRKSGNVKLFKKTGDWYVPVKYGLYQSFYIAASRDLNFKGNGQIINPSDSFLSADAARERMQNAW